MRGQPTEQQILCDRESRHQRQLLGHHGHSRLQRSPRRSESHRRSLDFDVPAVGTVDPAQHFGQRGLPRPVLAHKSVDLPSMEGDVGGVHTTDSAERLCQPNGGEESRGGGTAFLDPPGRVDGSCFYVSHCPSKSPITSAVPLTLGTRVVESND